MKFLVDTSVLIHSQVSKPKLNQRALQLLEDDSFSELFLSPISTWEIAIKIQQGRLTLPDKLSEFLAKARHYLSLELLDVTHVHALALGELPRLHRDPFDRMLIAQARAEGFTVLTTDRVFQLYDVKQIYCGK